MPQVTGGDAGVIPARPARTPPPRRGETVSELDDLTVAARRLLHRGFVHFAGPWPDWETAKWDSLRVMMTADACHPMASDMPALAQVGEFLVPPPGAVRRDYQALHIDFGWPLVTDGPVDLARFTALYVDGAAPSAQAVTRIVSLRSLLGQRSWPCRDVLAQRLRNSAGPTKSVEGILGRLIEILDDGGAALPAACTPGFLCGMEFSSRLEEDRYFRSLGMELATAERRLVLRPGEVLVLDNLRTAHGRLGRRRTGELHQFCLGYRRIDPDRQGVLLDGILAALLPV